MAYDIHIIKAAGWTETRRQPVTPYDLDVLFEKDPELQWSVRDTYEKPDDFDRLTRCYVIKWRNEPCFHYFNGEIVCIDAEAQHIHKMVDMASKINGTVIGDDGECYRPRKLLFWKTGITIKNAQ